MAALRSAGKAFVRRVCAASVVAAAILALLAIDSMRDPTWFGRLLRVDVAHAEASSAEDNQPGDPGDPAKVAAAPADAAAPPEQRFESANAAFAAGRYDEAIQGFESLAAEHGYSPALLFDLGNSYVRAGRIGAAVLAYERALVLAPWDDDTRANLRQARQAADLPEPEPGAWERIADLLSWTGWAYLLSGALYATCLALALLRLIGARAGDRSPVRRALRATAAIGAVVTVGAGALLAARLAQLDRGVVVAEQPTLRVAPYDSATVTAELSPGELVEIEREHNGFALVRTAKGRSGWTNPGSVGRIVSRSRDDAAADGSAADPAAAASSADPSDATARADAGAEDSK